MYVYVYIYVCVCAYVCIYIRIHISDVYIPFQTWNICMTSQSIVRTNLQIQYTVSLYISARKFHFHVMYVDVTRAQKSSTCGSWQLSDKAYLVHFCAFWVYLYVICLNMYILCVRVQVFESVHYWFIDTNTHPHANIHTYTRTRTCMHTHAHTSARTHLKKHIHAHIHAHTHANIFTRSHSDAHAYT